MFRRVTQAIRANRRSSSPRQTGDDEQLDNDLNSDTKTYNRLSELFRLHEHGARFRSAERGENTTPIDGAINSMSKPDLISRFVALGTELEKELKQFKKRRDDLNKFEGMINRRETILNRRRNLVAIQNAPGNNETILDDEITELTGELNADRTALFLQRTDLDIRERALAISGFEELGAINNRIDPLRMSKMTDKYLRLARYFAEVLKPGSSQVTMLPQNFLMIAADKEGRGVCLPLVVAMAKAMATPTPENPQARKQHLIENLYFAAAKIPMKFNMFHVLSRFHGMLQGLQSTHSEGKDINDIVNEVESREITTFYSMEAPKHSMLVGVTVGNGEKTFHFYDPNIGIFDYSSAENMSEAIKKMMHTKIVADNYDISQTSPKFKLRRIDIEELNLVNIDDLGFHEDGNPINLANLSDPPPQLASTSNWSIN